MARTDYPPATLAVLFYKHEKFVEDTVAGALSQTYPNLEIIFSDDNSPDGTFEVLKKAVEGYQGPHKVILNRNERNMGLVQHVNKLLFELAHGEFLFLNGGDDVSMPERVSRQMDHFLSDPAVMAVTGSYITIDKDGKETGKGILDSETRLRIDDGKYLKSSSFMTGGVALALRKTVLDRFGRLGDCQTEDSVLRFRSLLLGPMLKSPELLLKYRVHDSNISRDIRNFDTRKIAAQYMADLDTVKESIPPELYKKLAKKIRHYERIRLLQEKQAGSPRLLRPLYELRHKCMRLAHILSSR
ncbi:MAG: glycosyltransferase [Bacteroidales bacterium]|nr:glycosyltransferase [Bacteroidales bacterium]